MKAIKSLRKVVALASLLLVCGGPSLARAATITNVMPVNVTPTGFGILWRIASSTPSINVFADAGGLTNLTGSLEIEAFPLHTGNPDLPAGYPRRLNQAVIRQKTQNLGLMHVRVLGCTPGTTYYYQLKSTFPDSTQAVYPASGPLPSIKTASENTFVIDDQQLIIDVPGIDSLGSIITLSNASAAYNLAAVVGDGVGTNQVIFNANDLFALAGGNFATPGLQQFTADLLGSTAQSDTVAQFALTFGTTFNAGVATRASFGIEFLAVSIGSAAVQTGHSTNVWVGFNSSAAVADLSLAVDLPPGHLTNLALQALAPEIDPLSATVTAQGLSTSILHMAARSGQAIIGNKPLGQLAFAAIPGQHSAFVPLTLRQITAVKPDSSLVTKLFGQSGRAVVIGPEALLDGQLAPDGTRDLTLFGNPFSSYAIEYANSLNPAGLWTRLPLRIPLTTLSEPIQLSDPIAGQVFYRAVEFVAEPPILDAALAPDGTGQLTLYGQPGSSYLIQYATGLGTSTTWTTLQQVTLGTAFTFLQVTNPVSGMRFYRAVELLQPFLKAILKTDGISSLLLSAPVGTRYVVEQNPDILNSAGWQPLTTVTLTNSTATVDLTNRPARVFYRLRQN